MITGSNGGNIEGTTVSNAGRIAAVTPGKNITLSTALTINNEGVLEASGGDIEAPGVVQNQQGTRTPATLNNTGTVRLGVGGDLRVGSIAQSASSRVDVVLGGTGEEQLGQAHASGQVQFAGTLGVEAAPGYTVLPGSSFEIVTYGSRDGAFDSVVNNTGLAGLTFTPVYDADSLTLVSGALAGDANLDGRVNATDLLTTRRHLGREGLDWTGGDFDGNGLVNTRDVLLLRRNYGAAIAGLSSATVPAETPKPGAMAGAVPEPTQPLAMLAAASLLGRRRGRRR